MTRFRSVAARAAACTFSACVCTLVLLAANAAPVVAQETDRTAPGDTLRIVELSDGSTLYGTIVAEDEDSITVELRSGAQVTLDRADIESIELAVGKFVEGEFWTAGPNPSRLFVATTARPVPAGEAYVGVYELVFPFVAVGVTDRISLTAGAPILLGTLEFFYLGGKATVVDTRNVDIAAGTIAFFAPEGPDGLEPAGILFGVATLGSRYTALTLGTGFGFAGGDVASDALFLVGGETRVSEHVKLITENYFATFADGAALSGGVRFMSGQLTADAGVAALVGGGGSECCLPIVNFTYSFGG